VRLALGDLVLSWCGWLCQASARLVLSWCGCARHRRRGAEAAEAVPGIGEAAEAAEAVPGIGEAAEAVLGC
jgi:hypothetical protein